MCKGDRHDARNDVRLKRLLVNVTEEAGCFTLSTKKRARVVSSLNMFPCFIVSLCVAWNVT